MTSVLSHLLRSNGSKLVFLMSMLYLSCSTTQTTTSRPTVIKKDDPKTQQPTDSEAVPVDTIQWTWADEEVYPPIKTEGTVGV